MLNLSLSEAQLFRLLTRVFGSERVIPRMSVLAVCGGTLPGAVEHHRGDMLDWAKKTTCLFTVVDEDNLPQMVVEFCSGFDRDVDVLELEHHQYVRPILDAGRVLYIAIHPEEFHSVLDPASGESFDVLIRAKVSDAIEEQGVLAEAEKMR